MRRNNLCEECLVVTLENNIIKTTIGRLSTYYRPGNPTIVFLSGVGSFSTKENFTAIIKRLPITLGILTVDYPNVGNSSLTNQKRFGLSDWVNAIKAVLDHFQIADYLLVVHSISGFVGLKLTSERFGCRGFVGIEPSTVAVMSGDITYPEEFGRVNQIVSELGLLDYLKQFSSQGLNEKENLDLWNTFEQNEKRLATVEEFDFSFQPTPNDLDLLDLSSIPYDIPSVIFSQLFRKDEYEKSEYSNHHQSSRLYLGGESHYLHWTEYNTIVKVIKSLL